MTTSRRSCAPAPSRVGSHRHQATEKVPDQIIDALMALSLHDDASHTHPLAAWVVMDDQPGYAGHLIARLVTDTPTAYVLVAGDLGALRTQSPPGLERSPCQPGDPPGLIETWFWPSA
jgi:hypothetical protein